MAVKKTEEQKPVTLRDQIAMSALQGLIAYKPFHYEEMTIRAYQIADFAMEVRNRDKLPPYSCDKPHYAKR